MSLCYNPQVLYFNQFQGELFVILRFKHFILLAVLIVTNISFVSAQETTNKPDKKTDNKPQTDLNKSVTAEQIAETAILLYGTRDNLNQIRKSVFERGKINITNAEGKIETANYERWILRGSSLDKERIRFDQEYPNAKFSLVYKDDKIFGVFNDSVFTPRVDASKAFENQIWHGLEALLRYKENGATVELTGREKIMGVEFHLLDVTDKQNRKTRFYISARTFRAMMLEYTEDGVKYRRKFYDYNYAQGTLFPYRTILWADGKQIEETEVLTITFGQKVEENLFQGS